MVEEAKKGTLWSNDEFLRIKAMSENSSARLNHIGDLVNFWTEKKDAMKRLIVKKNLPFK